MTNIRRVYKYKIDVSDGDQLINAFGASYIMHVGMQDGSICAWVECEPEKPPASLRVRVFGTGHPIPEGYEWRGTVQDGGFVWHIYENTRPLK